MRQPTQQMHEQQTHRYNQIHRRAYQYTQATCELDVVAPGYYALTHRDF